MNTAMTALRRWVDLGLRTLCVTLFAVLVLLVLWQVFTRLVLDAPSAWTEEAARFAFVWVSMIGIAIAAGEKADVVMDVVVARLPKTWQRLADIVAYLATMAFVAYAMIYGGGKSVHMTWSQTNPLLPFTQGQLYLALPVAGVLLVIYLLFHLGHAVSREYEARTSTIDERGSAA